MASITHKGIIVETLRSNGSFQGDPVPASIFAFQSVLAGEENWAIFYDARHCDIYDSPYVIDPVCLWDENGITPEGTKWLEENG